MGSETLVVSAARICVKGVLEFLPLLQVVLGRAVQGEALLTGQGLLLAGVSEPERERLAFYAGNGRDGEVQSADGVVAARIFGDPSLPASQSGLAEAVATAHDIMALYGVKTARDVQARTGSMAVRGAARVRAAASGPTRLRYAAAAGDVAVIARREPYARFFSVEEYDLRHRRFDGATSPLVTRAAFISGDAVTVLPYDPERDRVLVVEQFRAGPFARGDAHPWQIEAIAGRIDPGETPQDAARREATEEAGLTLDALLDVAQYYPSPGICAEYLYSYVAVTNLADDAEGFFGVEGEAEDIRAHLMSFDDLMALVASGEVANAPLILTAFWLAARRHSLRGA